MSTVLFISISIVSVFVILLILIQGKGAGLGSAWGGGGELFQTRRGIEKWTLHITIFLIVVFLIFSLLLLFS
jgi:protein translocase SecG subunit